MSAGERLAGTPDPQHYWTGIDGVQLAGDTWGPIDGPLVMLLHGGGQTRHAWKGAGERLGAKGYFTVAYDARGHGDSDWAKDANYEQATMVADLVALLEQLGPGRRPVLVGASMGGGVSLAAIGREHVDATALILVDVAPRLEPGGVDKILSFMFSNPDGFASLDEVADAIASYQPHRKRPSDVTGLAKNVRRTPDGRYRWHWDPAFLQGPRNLDVRQAQQEADARNTRVPTLLVRGGLSDIVSVEGAREFLALCPQADFVDVDGASHMVAGDRNDIFADAVIEFLVRTVPLDGEPVHPPHRLQPRRDDPEVYDVP